MEPKRNILQKKFFIRDLEVEEIIPFTVLKIKFELFSEYGEYFVKRTVVILSILLSPNGRCQNNRGEGGKLP